MDFGWYQTHDLSTISYLKKKALPLTRLLLLVDCIFFNLEFGRHHWSDNHDGLSHQIHVVVVGSFSHSLKCYSVILFRWHDEIKSGENALFKYKANLETLFTRFVVMLCSIE